MIRIFFLSCFVGSFIIGWLIKKSYLARYLLFVICLTLSFMNLRNIFQLWQTTSKTTSGFLGSFSDMFYFKLSDLLHTAICQYCQSYSENFTKKSICDSSQLQIIHMCLLKNLKSYHEFLLKSCLRTSDFCLLTSHSLTGFLALGHGLASGPEPEVSKSWLEIQEEDALWP